MQGRLFAVQMLLLALTQLCGCAADQPAKTILNVALFGYIPDDYVVEANLKKKFERINPTCQVTFTSIDPYHDQDSGGLPSLQHFKEFDVVETDLCRLDDLVQTGLDTLPSDWAWYPRIVDCVGGAKRVVGSDQKTITLPHWICENFSISWAQQNTSTRDGNKSFALGDFWGTTGLGELYANALMDCYGAVEAEKQLRELAKSKTTILDSKAESALKTLVARLPSHCRDHLPFYHDHSEWYGSRFGARHDAVLVGYSESLFYTELEMDLLNGDSKPTHLTSADITIRPLTIGAGNGTPSWVDGFVIPKGKLASKKELIESFLVFMKSADAYACFETPEPSFAAANLLPAYADFYDAENTKREEPLLSEFRDRFDATFPVLHSEIWKGMKAAGKIIEKDLQN